MSARVFLDTNVLIYADDLNSPKKGAVALTLLEDCFQRKSGVLSTQVLQEYFEVAVSKLRVPADVARRKVELFASLDVFPIRVEDILGAIDLHRLHGYSFWDCLILRAALESGCTVCYTEDMEDGRQIGSLRIVNPFLPGRTPTVREKPAAYRARKPRGSAKRPPRKT
jgi:predicted nucleic acid-binding protein